MVVAPAPEFAERVVVPVTGSGRGAANGAGRCPVAVVPNPERVPERPETAYPPALASGAPDMPGDPLPLRPCTCPQVGLFSFALVELDIEVLAFPVDRPAPVVGAGSGRTSVRGSGAAPNGIWDAVNFEAASVEGRRLGVVDMVTCYADRLRRGIAVMAPLSLTGKRCEFSDDASLVAHYRDAIRANFVSGARELRAATGARLQLSADGMLPGEYQA